VNEKKRRPIARYLDAKESRLMSGEFSKAIRKEMQEAFLEALQSRDPLDEEMRIELMFAFEALAAGYAPELLTPVTRRGAPSNKTPIDKCLQQDAMRYINWATAGFRLKFIDKDDVVSMIEGKIDDLKPFRTVAEAYDLVERTIRNWHKNHDPKDIPKLVLGMSDDPSSPNYFSPAEKVARYAQHATNLMKISGKQYHRFVTKYKPAY
jgi:hypothetical protein